MPLLSQELSSQLTMMPLPLPVRGNFLRIVGVVLLYANCHHVPLIRDKCDESIALLDISDTATLWNSYRQVSSLPDEEARECFTRALVDRQPQTVALGTVGLWSSGDAVNENLRFTESLEAVVDLAAKISEPVTRVFPLYQKYPGESFDDALTRHARLAETDDVKVLMMADSWMEHIPPPAIYPKDKWGAKYSPDATPLSLGESDREVAEAICVLAPSWHLFYLEARGRPPSFRTRPGFRSSQVFLRWVAAAAGGDSVSIVTKKDEEGVDIVKGDGLCETDHDCLPWRRCARICGNGKGICVGEERIATLKNKFPDTVVRIRSIQ